MSKKVGFLFAVSIRALTNIVLLPPAGERPHTALMASVCNPLQAITVAFWLGVTFHRGRRFCVIVTPNRRINSSGVAVLVNRPHMVSSVLIKNFSTGGTLL